MTSRNGTQTPTPQQAARQLWNMGANVTSIPAGGKEPAHEWNSKKAPWATERQDLDIVNSLPWNTQRKVWRGRIDPPIETVGIISGPGGWRVLDIDPTKDDQGSKIPVPVEVVHAVRSALGLPDDYPWQGPSRSGAGWHVWFRCDDELPPELAAATNSKESGVKIGVPLPDYASAFDHIELRWDRCQTVLPAPSGYNGHLPSEPPARVDIDQARAAFLAIATPKKPDKKPDNKPRQNTNGTTPHSRNGTREQRWKEACINRQFEKAADMVSNPSCYHKEGYHKARFDAGRLLGGLVPAGHATPDEIEDFLLKAKPPEHDRAKEEKAIRDGIAAGEEEPLDLPSLPENPEPIFDDDGYACCPVCSKRLKPAKNGNGWRCLTSSGELCFWWAGNGTDPEQADADQAEDPDDAAPTGWRAPLPLEDCAVGPFPDDALPGWLHTYTAGVATELEIDHGAVALLALSALGTIYQRRYKVVVTHGLAPHEESLALWTLFTAAPGERKSPALKAIIGPLTAYQKRYNAYQQAQHAQASEAQEDGPPLDPPPPLALALTDTTQEALVTTLEEQHERAAIFSSEGNSLFSVHLGGVYRGGAADVSLLNAAWSGDVVDVSRKQQRQRSTLYNPAVSMGVCIQPGVLSGASAKGVSRASGFLSRWLYCCPDSKLGERTGSAPELDTGPRLMYEGTITRLLEDAFPLEYPAPAPEVSTLSLDRAAYAAFVQYRQQVEPRLGNKNALSVYRDWYAKAPGQAIRVAALLALIDGAQQISDAHMRRGVAVVEWSAAHMQRAYGISAGADMGTAQRAAAWIQRKQKTVLTVRDVQRGLTISKEEAQDAVDTLADYGYLRELEEGRRRAIEYEVHPALLSESVRNPPPTGNDTNTAAQRGTAEKVSESVRSSVRYNTPHQNGVNNEVSGKTKNSAHHDTPPTTCAGQEGTCSVLPDTCENTSSERSETNLTHTLTLSDTSPGEPHQGGQNSEPDSLGDTLTLPTDDTQASGAATQPAPDCTDIALWRSEMKGALVRMVYKADPRWVTSLHKNVHCAIEAVKRGEVVWSEKEG